MIPEKLPINEIIVDKAPTSYANMPQTLCFTFPVTFFNFDQFSNADELLQEFSKEVELAEQYKANIFKQKFFPSRKVKNYGLWECKYCQAFIKMKRYEDQSWKILTYNNEHKHPLQKIKSLEQKSIFQKVKELGLQTRDQVTKLLQSKYGVKSRRIRYILSKIFPDNNYFGRLEKLFKEQKFEYKFYYGDNVEKKIPENILAVAPYMVQNYIKYGDYMSLDFFYEFVIEKNEQQYIITLLTGQDNSQNDVIFAVLAFKRQDARALQFLIRDFFRIIKNNHTVTIITDDKQFINTAIQKLKTGNQVFTGLHQIKVENIINQLQNKLVMPPLELNILIKNFENLLKENNIQKGLQQIQKILQQINQTDENIQIIDYLVSNSKKIFLWAVQNHFVGLSKHYRNQEQKFLKVLKKNYNIFSFFVNIIRNTRHGSTQENKIDKKRLEQHFMDFKLKRIRERLSLPVFQIFMKQYVYSQRCKFVSHNEKVFEIQNVDEVNLKYIIQNWKCSCKYSIKTGIPCGHQIFVARKYKNMQYDELFNKRWLIRQQKMNQQNWNKQV